MNWMPLLKELSELIYCFFDVLLLYKFNLVLLKPRYSNVMYYFLGNIIITFILYLLTIENYYSTLISILSLTVLLVYSTLLFDGQLVKKILVVGTDLV